MDEHDDGRDSENELTAPHALLDTNVMLSIYSWHDLVEVIERVRARKPEASLRHPEIQFRAQRLRWGFLLSLFLDEKGWRTTTPGSELMRTLVRVADPAREDHLPRVGFTTIYAHFVREFLLTRWLIGIDPSEDASIKGNDVDVLCVRCAARYSIPLVSWEGIDSTGAVDNTKTLRKEALQREVLVLTPEELLRREHFNTPPAKKRFFDAWDLHATDFLRSYSGHAAENLAFARQIFMRLAKNDWEP